jgi:hydroxypyruvate isomerase
VASINLRDLLGYILSRTGCIHPFRISRIIALAELYHLEEKGERLTSLVYVRGPGVFYIEGVKEVIENDECFEKKELPTGGGCIEYKCGEPSIPEELRIYIDRAIEEASKLDDRGLNDRVVKHRLYDRLFEK